MINEIYYDCHQKHDKLIHIEKLVELIVEKKLSLNRNLRERNHTPFTKAKLLNMFNREVP